MKKLLILMTILTISFFAFLDAKKLLTELKEVSYARTPSQIEMRPLINQARGTSSNVQFDRNQNSQHDQMRQDNRYRDNFQNSIDRMNNRLNTRDKRYPKP